LSLKATCGRNRRTKNPSATTAAAMRKTKAMESENPTLNGSAIAAGSSWMNEVSDRSPAPPSCWNCGASSGLARAAS